MAIPNSASDNAIGGALAREDGLSGAGITIGIISDSFDNLSSFAGEDNYADDVAAEYLPGNVEILEDGQTLDDDGQLSGNDEGRAMAELIYETAPAAQIVFCSGDDGTGAESDETEADAVEQLESAHCDIIVDDTGGVAEPDFQLGTDFDNAVESFVAQGGDYFTAAGNDGDAYYASSFLASETSISSLGDVDAMQFGSSGSELPFEVQSLSGAVTAILQWDQPYSTIPADATGGPGSDTNLDFYLIDPSSGAVLASSTVNALGNDPEQVITAQLTAGQDYEFVVTLPNGDPAAGQIRITGFDDSFQLLSNNPDASTGDLFGHALIPGINVVGASNVDTIVPGHAGTPEPYSEYGPGEILFDDQGNALANPETPAGISYVAPDGSTTTVPGALSTFTGTSAAAPVAAAVAALMLQANPNLTSEQVTQILSESAISMDDGQQVGAGLIQAQAAVELAEALACYAEGTLIQTAHGQIAIEHLKVGDSLQTVSGELMPIVWIGHRKVNCRKHRDPKAVQPVCITQHAFGQDLPKRDLYLSPDHAIFVAEVLIPIKHLINGTTVRQFDCDPVTYYHVELACHSVIAAEGLPAESYLNTDDRSSFANGSAALKLHAVFGSSDSDATFLRDALSYAPLMVHGTEVESARETLSRLSQAIGQSASNSWDPSRRVAS